MTTRSAVAALIAAVVLAPAATAQAKTRVGTGGAPSAVAAPDGTVHVVWTEFTGGSPSRHTAHYCRVAPGTEHCAVTKDWDVQAVGSAAADVVRNPGNGDVHVVISVKATGGSTNAPYNAGGGLYVATQTEAGAATNTWTGPVRRTTAVAAYEVGNTHVGTVFGPGAYQLTWMSAVNATPGARLTFAPTDGSGTQGAIDNLVPGAAESNIGLIAHDRALLVARRLDQDGGQLVWRAQSGSNPRDVAQWRPQRSTGPGAVGGTIDLAANAIAPPALASIDPVAGTDRRIALRRYDDAADAFTAPVTVSDDDEAHQLEVFLDAASNVHALFTTNTRRYAESASHALVYTASQTGAAWPKYGIVLDRDTTVSTPVALGAGQDGTGVAVWARSAGSGSSADDEIYLGRVGGPGSAWPTDPPPPGPPAPGGGGATPTPPPVDPSCVKTAAVGTGRLLSSGCFKRSGTKLTTAAPFLLNGLTVDPKGKTATVETAKRTVSGPAGGTVAFGPVMLVKGAFEWTLPASGTWKVPATLDLDKAGFGAELLGLKVVGDATLKLTDGRSVLSTYLRLPAPFGGVSGALDLKGDNFTGLQLDGLTAHADSLGFGFEDLDLSYTSDPPTWTGKMAFRPSVLPKDESANRFSATVRIVNGKLERVAVDGQFAAPGLSLYPPLVYLRYAGLELTTDPLTITGKTVLAGGPGGIVSVGRPYDAFGKVTVRLTDPFSVAAEGPIHVLGFNVGSGYFNYTYPGDIAFGAKAQLGSCGGGIAGAEAQIDGFIHVGSSFAMNAAGQGRACLGKLSAGASAVVSTKGIAACADFSVPPISAGAGHVWGTDGVDVMAVGCDTAPYAVAQGAQAGGARTFTVKPGVKQLNVALTGDAGVPQATLVGPGGVTYAGAPAGETVTSPTHAAVGSTVSRRQVLLIARPPAGTWTVQPAEGSPGIVKVDLARDAPPARVRGRLGRAGARRELRWTVAGRSGQVVTLYEEGDGVLRKLGVARGQAGVVRWSPEVVRGGKRRVTAVVEQAGLPQARVVLASYTVPRPAPPGTARRLRVARSRGALVVRWTPGRNAAAQELRVRLSSGLAQVVRLGRRAGTYRVPAVAGAVTGSVSVVAIRADGRQGRPGRVTVRAAKAKPKRRS